MARNFVQAGSALTLTAPYARTAGQAALIGAIFAIALSDVGNGAEGEFAPFGVWDLDKTDAQAWALGDKIYWDAGNKACSNVPTVGALVGVAVASAANPTDVGRVFLCGCAPDLLEGKQAVIADADPTNTGIAVNDAGATAVATAAELDAVAVQLNLVLATLRAVGIIATA